MQAAHHAEPGSVGFAAVAIATALTMTAVIAMIAMIVVMIIGMVIVIAGMVVIMPVLIIVHIIVTVVTARPLVAAATVPIPVPIPIPVAVLMALLLGFDCRQHDVISGLGANSRGVAQSLCQHAVGSIIGLTRTDSDQNRTCGKDYPFHHVVLS